VTADLNAGRKVIDPNDYLVDSFHLARKIWDDGYRPDFLIGLWRGGAPPGIVIQEFFRWKGHDPYHTAIRTQSLEGVGQGGGFDIKGFEHVLDVVEAGDQMLLVDDVLNTGQTVYEVVRYLRQRARRNAPEVRVATVYYRPQQRRFPVCPDYYLHEVDDPPALPYRLTQIAEDDVRDFSPELHEVLYG
jgi:hypoxanthine phosphoribosyltransferase